MVIVVDLVWSVSPKTPWVKYSVPSGWHSCGRCRTFLEEKGLGCKKWILRTRDLRMVQCVYSLILLLAWPLHSYSDSSDKSNLAWIGLLSPHNFTPWTKNHDEYLFPQLASLVHAITMMKKLTNEMMSMSEERTVWTKNHLLKEIRAQWSLCWRGFYFGSRKYKQTP